MQKKCTYITVLITFIVYGMFANAQTFAQALQPVTRGVTVNAIVPPSINDFHFSFVARGEKSVRQNQILTYDITYGARSSAGQSTRNTIVVRYSGDRDPNNAYLVNYIIGSATTAYDGVQPVIDQHNRTITWTIPSLPQGIINQKVSFQLRTASNSFPSQKLPIINTAVLTNTFFSTPQISTSQEFVTDIQQPGTQPTTTESPIASPFPSIVPQQIPAPEIVNITQTLLTPTQTTIEVRTNKPAQTTVYYGLAPNSLITIAESLPWSTYHSQTLKELIPGKQYFYKIAVKDTEGNTRWSDTLTFTTPKLPMQTANPIRGAVTLLSKNYLIHSSVITGTYAQIILPKFIDYQLIFTPESSANGSDIDLLITSETGLQHVVKMTANDKTSYTGSLQTGAPGKFTLVLLQKDKNNTILSKKIAEVTVSEPFRVTEFNSEIPVTEASITLTRYDVLKNTFVPYIIDQSNFNYTVIYTNRYGQAFIVVPPGLYRAEVRALGYAPKTIIFSIDSKTGDAYPLVELEKDVFNTAYITHTIKISIQEGVTNGVAQLNKLTMSLRIYYLSAIATLSTLVSLSVITFGYRTNIEFSKTMPFVLFHLYMLRKSDKNGYLRGIIKDDQGNPIEEVYIDIMQHDESTVIAHTTTDKLGRFQFNNNHKYDYVKLVLSKDGYPIVERVEKTDANSLIKIIMKKKVPSNKSNSKAVMQEILGSFFEVILIISLIVELLFIQSFGIIATLPFITISFLNLMLWLFYHRQTHN